MEQALRIILLIHVAFGFTSLASGIAAMVFRKGSKQHNQSGKIFYWSMLGIGVTAFLVAIPKANMFLLMVGGFSTYMTLTGFRMLQWRRSKTPTYLPKDRIYLFVGLLTLIIPALYFTSMGWSRIGGFSLVFGVFGCILISMLLGDFIGRKQLFMRPKGWFLSMHISRMMGAFIATFTAFLLINWQTNPVYIAWLLPTLVFTPVIFYYQNKFKVSARHLKAQKQALVEKRS
jgi:uncharacterized membrane protein